MPTNNYIAYALLVSAGVTWALRAIPFTFLRKFKDHIIVKELAGSLPVGIMAILVLQTLKDVPVDTPKDFLPVLISIILTVGLHLWRHNAILSIGSGTVLYIILIGNI